MMEILKTQSFRLVVGALIVLLATPLICRGEARPPGRVCATPEPTAEFLEATRRDLAAIEEIRGELTTQAGFSARLPLIFHVIQKPSGKGFVTDEAIAEQVRILNNKYRKLGVEFYVEAVNDVVRAGWFKHCLPGKPNGQLNQKFFKMTRRLVEDPVTRIHVITCRPYDDTLGFGLIAGQVRQDDYRNVIIMNHQALPGGPFGNYSRGIVMVHEMGHYLGLYHTFQPGHGALADGCDGEGDEVDDTPYEREPAWACEPRDSCPQAGTDPITNYMDYTDDLCRKKFTQGQWRRMENMVLLYRPGLLGLE